MSRAKPKGKPVMTARDMEASAPFSIGKKDAREWLQDPRAQSLAKMRFTFQLELVDIVDSMNKKNPSVQFPAEAILDGMTLYNAGVDKVLEEFVFLAMAAPQGGYQ